LIPLYILSYFKDILLHFPLNVVLNASA